VPAHVGETQRAGIEELRGGSSSGDKAKGALEGAGEKAREGGEKVKEKVTGG